MNRFLFTIPVTAAAILATSVSVFAADEKPKGPESAQTESAPAKRGPGDRLKELSEKLALTGEQKEKVKAILEANMPKVKAIRTDSALSDEDKKAKMQEIRKAEVQEIRAVLTPEQQAKMKELRGAAKAPKADK